MNKEQFQSAQTQLTVFRTLRDHYQEQFKTLEPSLLNARYIKVLSKLNQIDSSINFTQRIIKSYKRQNRLSRRLNVAINSRVKLVALDIEITLWVDAKNVTAILGKRIGEVVDLYNAQFKIAAIY